MEKEFENGLRVRINESNKTASVISSPKVTGRVTVPHYAEFGDQKYKIIAIKERSFEQAQIDFLEFPEESEVEIFESKCFYFAQLKKLQIPPKLKFLEGGWCNWVKDLTEIEVSPKNSLFSFYEGNFLLGKSEPQQEDFDVLHYARYDIENAVIPPQVKVLKECSFYWHPNLKSITFSSESTLKIIEDYVISQIQISILVLPSTVEKIGEFNFCSVKNLAKVEIVEGNNNFKLNEKGMLFSKSDISSNIFDKLIFSPRNIEHVTIPNYVKIISNDAFNQCNQIKSITFEPNSSLEIISSDAFNSASLPSNIIIPETVKNFGFGSFANIETLNSIEIRGQSVILDTNCFSCCINLSLISFPNATKIDISHGSFTNLSKEVKIKVRKDAEISGSGYQVFKSFFSNIEVDNNDKVKIEETETSNESSLPIGNEGGESGEIDDKEREILRLAKQIRYLEHRLSKYENVKPTEISSKYEPKQNESKIKNEEDNAKECENFFIDREKEENYETIEKIGEGRHCIAMKIVDKNTSERYCKKILKGDSAEIKDVQNAFKEFELLHSLKHPCICRSYYINTQEVFIESTPTTDEMTTISVYLEYVDFKLEELLRKRILNNTLKTRIAVEIAHGMKYLHERGLIYRDLKLGSVMLNSVFETKLIDFSKVHVGVGEFESDNSNDIYKTRRVGEEGFMSPEMMRGDEYDNKTDVFSFGIILHIIFTGNQPSLSIKDLLDGKSIPIPKQSPNISENCIELIMKCLSYDPSERPSFEEILRHIRSRNYLLAPDVDSRLVLKRDNELEGI